MSFLLLTGTYWSWFLISWPFVHSTMSNVNVPNNICSPFHLPQYLDVSLFVAILKLMDLWSGIPNYSSTETSSPFPKARCYMIWLWFAISTDCSKKLLWIHLTKLALFRFSAWRKSQSIMGICHWYQKLDVLTYFSNFPRYLFLCHTPAIGIIPLELLHLSLYCIPPLLPQLMSMWVPLTFPDL